MKTRIGYVSNSSSSSFCIVGVCTQLFEDFEPAKMLELNPSAKKILEEVEQKPFVDKHLKDKGMTNLLECDTRDFYSIVWNNTGGETAETLFGKLKFEYGISEFEDYIVIGYDIDKIKEGNLTYLEFRKQVFEDLQKIGFTGKEEDVDIMVDGGSDC